jgi:transcription elongation factor GreA
MTKKVPMTVEGAKRLKAELHRLKTVDRPTVIAAIAEARSHGDLAENADYDAAKERQGFIEGRIAEVERRLAHAQVIDPADLSDAGTGVEVTYQIVGDDEADLKHGKISVSSPIARALIGKVEGETVEVHAPGGVREYEILVVRYG